jgi:hypothetical protein
MQRDGAAAGSRKKRRRVNGSLAAGHPSTQPRPSRRHWSLLRSTAADLSSTLLGWEPATGVEMQLGTGAKGEDVREIGRERLGPAARHR